MQVRRLEINEPAGARNAVRLRERCERVGEVLDDSEAGDEVEAASVVAVRQEIALPDLDAEALVCRTRR